MYAIGSSYLIRQSPGAERFGGVTLKLWTTNTKEPIRKVIPTSWSKDQQINDDIRFLAAIVEKGIEQFVAEHNIDLNSYSWELSKFAYHPTDSKPEILQLAGYNAFASAWASWHSMRLKSVS